MPKKRRMDFKKYTINNLGDMHFAKGIRRTITTLVGPYVPTSADYTIFLNNFVVTLPDAESHVGREFVIHNSGNQASTIVGITGVTLPPGETATIISDGLIWRRLY